MGSYEFDRAVAVRPDGDRWAAEIASGWDINGNANGGYVMALAANALRAAAGRADPVTVTVHYLAPATPGPVQIDAEVAKQGKRFATVSGAVRRGDREIARVLGTFGDLGSGEVDGVRRVFGEPPDLAPMEKCVRRPAVGAWVSVPLMERLQVLVHPDDAGLLDDRPSGTSVVRGWFAFADGRPVDTLGLLLAPDTFPPTVFNLDGFPVGWVPTVELTVHVRARPAPGPLRCRFQTRFVTDGALEEDGELWDSTGRLVALSRQYGLVART